jgi:MinD superfamily P-loop ATPase
MRQGFINREHASTAFVLLDRKKCEACWKCQEGCLNNVIGRINMPWHKHVKFVKKSNCTGCMKCVKICATGAISSLTKGKEDC